MLARPQIDRNIVKLLANNVIHFCKISNIRINDTISQSNNFSFWATVKCVNSILSLVVLKTLL